MLYRFFLVFSLCFCISSCSRSFAQRNRGWTSSEEEQTIVQMDVSGSIIVKCGLSILSPEGIEIQLIDLQTNESLAKAATDIQGNFMLRGFPKSGRLNAHLQMSEKSFWGNLARTDFATRECMLMEIAKYWKTIVDTLQDGLMVLDPEGNILAVNPAAERMTGYSADELIGNNCRTLNCTGCDVYGRGAGKEW